MSSCRAWKDLSFENKKVNLERISLDKDVSKILRGSLFLGHSLVNCGILKVIHWSIIEASIVI